MLGRASCGPAAEGATLGTARRVSRTSTDHLQRVSAAQRVQVPYLDQLVVRRRYELDHKEHVRHASAALEWRALSGRARKSTTADEARGESGLWSSRKQNGRESRQMSDGPHWSAAVGGRDHGPPPMRTCRSVTTRAYTEDVWPVSVWYSARRKADHIKAKYKEGERRRRKTNLGENPTVD